MTILTQSIPLGLATIANGRDILTTREAAHVLNRAEQTLRKWACDESGPIRPVHINRHLGWRVVDLAAALRGETPAISNAGR